MTMIYHTNVLLSSPHYFLGLNSSWSITYIPFDYEFFFINILSGSKACQSGRPFDFWWGGGRWMLLKKISSKLEKPEKIYCQPMLVKKKNNSSKRIKYRSCACHLRAKKIRAEIMKKPSNIKWSTPKMAWFSMQSLLNLLFWRWMFVYCNQSSAHTAAVLPRCRHNLLFHQASTCDILTTKTSNHFQS